MSSSKSIENRQNAPKLTRIVLKILVVVVLLLIVLAIVIVIVAVVIIITCGCLPSYCYQQHFS